jgi:hypothetical protein
MNLSRRNNNKLPTNNRFDALKASEDNPFRRSGGRRRFNDEQNVDPRPMRRPRNTDSGPALTVAPKPKFEIRPEAFPDLGAPRAEPEPMPSVDEKATSWAARLSSAPTEETKEETIVRPTTRAAIRRSGITRDEYECPDVRPGWISIRHDKETGDIIRSHGPVTEQMRALQKWKEDEPIRHARQMLREEQRRRDLDVELFGDFSEYYGMKSLLEEDTDDSSSEGDVEEDDSDASSDYMS